MWMTIDKMARRICLLRDDPSAKNYVKTAAAVSQAVNMMGIDSFPNVCTLEYVVDETYSFIIPDHVVVVGKVGIVRDSGIEMCREIESIGLSFDKKKLDEKIDCGDDSSSDDSSNSKNVFSNYYHADGTIGELYGYNPSDTRVCYNVFYGDRRIVFQSSGLEVGDVVVAEATLLPGKGEQGTEIIPPDAFDMIYHYASAYLDDHKRVSVANTRRVNAGSAKRIFDRRHSKMKLEDIYIYYRTGYTLSPSRD